MAIPFVIEKIPFEHSAEQHQTIGAPKLAHQFSLRITELPSATARPAAPVSLAALGGVAQLIAHDFRHHLCTVGANAEFLVSRTMDSANREELLDEIRAAIECMTEQLDSLLLFTRTGCNLQPRRQSLNLILERAIRMARAHPDAHHVEISSNDMPFLEASVDGLRLCSAIFNLLLNACQAAKTTPGMKTVDIVLNQNRQYIFIRVLDRGPGVPHAIRNTLFQPFVKAEGGSGTGLGLTIARCIAREHGGEVCLEESRPGKTVFVLKLSKRALKALSDMPNSASIA